MTKNNITDLRKSILQYAIKGKLVAQNPNDEPASELLKRMGVRNNRQNPLPPCGAGLGVGEEKSPFELPKGWEWCRFCDIVDYNIGKTPERKQLEYWTNGKYNWVSIADLVENSYVKTTKERVSEKANVEIYKKLKISKKGTLLMSFKLTLGKVSILDCDAFHNEAIISIYPKNDKNNVIKEFLFKLLPIITQYGKTKDAIKGTTLNSSSLNNLLIPLPPLPEQIRIVKKLEELEPLIQEYERLREREREF